MVIYVLKEDDHDETTAVDISMNFSEFLIRERLIKTLRLLFSVI